MVVLDRSYPLSDELGGVGNGGVDVGRRQRRVALKNLLARGAGGKDVEDDGNHDARACDARSTMADAVVGGDAVAPAHENNVSKRKWLAQ